MKLKVTGGWRKEYETEAIKLGFSVSSRHRTSFVACKGGRCYSVYIHKGDTMVKSILRAIKSKRAERLKKIQREKQYPVRPSGGMSYRNRRPMLLLRWAAMISYR